MNQMDYLESERKKLWEKVAELEGLIEKRTPDYEQEARQSSKKISEFRNKADTSRNEAKTLVDEIKRIADEIKQSKISEIVSELRAAHDDLVPRTEAIEAKLQQLETLFASYATYADQLSKLDGFAESADESNSKIEAIVKQFIIRKSDVDKLYYEIFGYSNTDQASGETVTVPGRKDELEKSYSELKNEFEKFSREKNEEFKKASDGWKAQFIAIHEKIESLLPDALTAGLSAAYSNKKKDELTDYTRLEGQFANAIKGLIAVSLIPFVVSIYFIYDGKSLAETIYGMPRLVLSILPLYIPVLWLAYSFNRKMNLSKRLIEEYTHKEVLSKTFEGLSTQIQNIKDADVSADLKARLLYNILEVSSENPGKLISNYDKSDHPLMDVLDKSIKLHNSIDYLSKVPGMSKLVDVLNKRADELLDKTTTKAVAGIEKATNI
ncbi:MAG: hypothetical protein PHH47_06420 [Gallionella sp.]|nr:hypothetical protein [Gallionella sp.]MDD4946819.1 hypothetical protein [Gallionella sp.]